MLDLLLTVNWLLGRVDEASSGTPLDLPNELWVLVFDQLQRRDLLALFATSKQLNQLVLPSILACSRTSLQDYFAGIWTVDADIVPLLSHALQLPEIYEITCVYDVHKPATPYLLQSLKQFVFFRPVRKLRLSFSGDLLSAYKSDLVPLTPQRSLTEPFCELLSSFAGGGSEDPVVLVGSEVVSSSAKDIRNWQLDKYSFGASEPLPARGLLSRLRFLAPATNPLRNKVPLRHHNGIITSVSPFISISSVHILRIEEPFSGRPWTLVLLNAESVHWPNTLRLVAAPLAAEEWDVVLPRLQFAMLPVLRMDSDKTTIRARALDAFLARHPTLTRINYKPDTRTLDDVLVPMSLPRLRGIAATALGARRLLRQPDALPNLSGVHIVHVSSASEMHDLLALFAQLRGTHKLILEAPAGSWLDAPQSFEHVIRPLSRVDMIVLSGARSPVDPEAIIRWVRYFPALRRVGLQDCLFRENGCADAEWEARRTRFMETAKKVLGDEDGLDVMVAV
uniref:F-box domain-containing protein n=1 Tax=Mycena chlorophos TaxID=658473 RepID=A0ABQ0L0W2_MYCCL|nr:predicted protein [Mycena chlorophos]